MDYLYVVLLLLASGLFSGLTLGVMSLEANELKRKAGLGNKNAQKLYPLRERGNQLLITLIIANVGTNSTLAIFLGHKLGGIYAGLLATALITLFAEILPQSVFSRFGLVLGAKVSGVIRVIFWILFPVTAPIAWVLDKSLGEELPKIYSRRELIEILEEHGKSQSSDITRDEEKIASGALSFGSKLVEEVMTPRSVVVSVSESDVIDEQTLTNLTHRGYSRFPVMDGAGANVVGILFAYHLINRSVMGKQAGELCSRDILYVNEGETLDKSFRGFIKTNQKMFIVVNQFQEYVGVLTTEDILEEIICDELVDEFDEYKDMRKVAEKVAREQGGRNHADVK